MALLSRELVKTAILCITPQLNLPGLRDRSGQRLLHDVAYYTLNQIPKP